MIEMVPYHRGESNRMRVKAAYPSVNCSDDVKRECHYEALKTLWEGMKTHGMTESHTGVVLCRDGERFGSFSVEAFEAWDMVGPTDAYLFCKNAFGDTCK